MNKEFDIGKDMFELMKRDFKVLNEDLIVKDNLHEMVSLLIWIVDGINHVIKKKDPKTGEEIITKNSLTYLCHTLRVPTQEERCKDILVDFYAKLEKFNGYFVELDRNDIMVIEMECMLSVDIYKKCYHQNLLHNTKVKLLQLLAEGRIEMSDKIKDIVEGVYEPVFKPNDVSYSEDLFYPIKMYIPINENGYYMLGDNKYYHGYWLKQPMTSKGKIKCEHNAFTSYLQVKNGMIVHEAFRGIYNPFIYSQDILTDDEFEKIFADELEDERTEDILTATFNEYVELMKTNDYPRPLDKVMSDVDFDYICEMMKLLLASDEEDDKTAVKQFHKYYTLIANDKKSAKTADKKTRKSGKSRGNINSDIRKYIPRNRNNTPEGTRRKWKPHAFGLCTAIKIGNQFPRHDTSNEKDIFFCLYYLKSTTSFLRDEHRKYNWNEMGIMDPISTSGSNVGASGALVPSMSSEYIVKAVGKREL